METASYEPLHSSSSAQRQDMSQGLRIKLFSIEDKKAKRNKWFLRGKGDELNENCFREKKTF